MNNGVGWAEPLGGSEHNVVDNNGFDMIAIIHQTAGGALGGCLYWPVA